mgnify:CR=1 FL=1
MNNTTSGKINDVNAIRIYGSNNPNIPQTKPSIVKLFSVVAEQYMFVPAEYLADVIRFLKSSGYVYKMKDMTRYTVFALQYQKP